MLTIVLTVVSIITLYQATAEMAYNREKHPVTVYEEKVDKTEFRKINDYFIKDLNKVTSEMQFEENGNLICPYSIKEMNDLLEEEFMRFVENNVEQVVRSAAEEIDKKKFKMDKRSKIFLIASIVLSGAMTIFTFVWGLL